MILYIGVIRFVWSTCIKCFNPICTYSNKLYRFLHAIFLLGFCTQYARNAETTGYSHYESIWLTQISWFHTDLQFNTKVHYKSQEAPDSDNIYMLYLHFISCMWLPELSFCADERLEFWSICYLHMEGGREGDSKRQNPKEREGPSLCLRFFLLLPLSLSLSVLGPLEPG